MELYVNTVKVEARHIARGRTDHGVRTRELRLLTVLLPQDTPDEDDRQICVT